MKLSNLFEYNKELGALGKTSLWVEADLDFYGQWIIQYECTELAITNRHIHAVDLNAGIKQVIEDVIEHCIWETEENDVP